MLRIRRGRGILIVINCIFFGVLDISFKTTRTTEDSKFERQAKTTRGAALSQRAICLHLKPVLLLPPGILAAKSVFRKRNLFFSLTPSMQQTTRNTTKSQVPFKVEANPVLSYERKKKTRSAVYVGIITVNTRPEDVKFVVIGKTSCRKSVPESINSQKEAVRMEFISY